MFIVYEYEDINEATETSGSADWGTLFLGALGVYAGYYIWKNYIKGNDYGIRAYNQIKKWTSKIRKEKKIKLDDKKSIDIKKTQNNFLNVMNKNELEDVKDIINDELESAKERAREYKENNEDILRKYRKPIIFYIIYRYKGEAPVQIGRKSNPTFQMIKALYDQQTAKNIVDEIDNFIKNSIEGILPSTV